jgi:hypothetical protein
MKRILRRMPRLAAFEGTGYLVAPAGRLSVAELLAEKNGVRSRTSSVASGLCHS